MNVSCFYHSLLWQPRIVSQIFLFWSHYVCVFCIYFQVPRNAIGKRRLCCLCRDSVITNCARFSKNWHWQTVWHFREACPDKAPLQSSRATTMNYRLRNCLKIRVNCHLRKLFIWRGAFFPSLPLPPSLLAGRRAAAADGRWERGYPQSYGLGQGHLSSFPIIINAINVVILFWSALTSMWNESSWKYLAAVMEPLTSHHRGTRSPLWLTAFFWWP